MSEEQSDFSNLGISSEQMQQMTQMMQNMQTAHGATNEPNNPNPNPTQTPPQPQIPTNLSMETKVTFQEALLIFKRYSTYKGEYCDNLLIGPGNADLGKDMFGGVFIQISIQFYAPFGGKEYTLCEESFTIKEFPHKIKLQDLPVQPVLDEETDDDISALIARGMQFLEYTQKPYYAHANGFMYIQTQRGFKRVPLDSRVVIDPSGYKRLYADRWHSKTVLDTVPDMMIYSTMPTVPVFSLEYRTWGEVPVFNLGDIQFDKTAFDRTVLPENYKKIIAPLIDNYYKTDCADFIAGKKKGLVVLLGGKPGTGKTLTAQGVAELNEKPLYCIGSGDLGTKPDEIDNNLLRIFNMVEKWEGMVLIDEADVFMSKRTDYNVEYNACVSVFLRLIENYSGLLFLTTNKEHAKIDAAFDSRIHIRLHYRELDAEGRGKVWKESLKRYNINNVNVSELETFKLNNREIANIVQLVYVTMGGDGDNITTEKVLEFINLRLDFNPSEDYGTIGNSINTVLTNETGSHLNNKNSSQMLKASLIDIPPEEYQA